MTRELKLALIIGVTLLLGVLVLVSDHLSVQRRPKLADALPAQPALVPAAVSEPVEVDLPTPKGQAPRQNDAKPRLALGPDGTDYNRDSLGPESNDLNNDLNDSNDPRETHTTIQQGRGGGIRIGTGNANLPPAARLTQVPLNGTQGMEYADAGSRTNGPASKWAVSRDDVSSSGSSTWLPGSRDTTNELLPAEVKSTRSHTIAQGDSAYKLARRYLGDGKYFQQIIDANPKAFGNSGQVKIGSVVVIPNLAPVKTQTPTRLAIDGNPQKPVLVGKPAKEGAKAKESGRNSYTVRRGDTLNSIARNQLGSTVRAQEILRLNKTVIKDPDSLPQGLAILLPSGQ